ncbi:MAG: hypothetical protein ACE5GW_00455 [Planctomycetota bacterium]
MKYLWSVMCVLVIVLAIQTHLAHQRSQRHDLAIREGQQAVSDIQETVAKMVDEQRALGDRMSALEKQLSSIHARLGTLGSEHTDADSEVSEVGEADSGNGTNDVYFTRAELPDEVRDELPEAYYYKRQPDGTYSGIILLGVESGLLEAEDGLEGVLQEILSASWVVEDLKRSYLRGEVSEENLHVFESYDDASTFVTNSLSDTYVIMQREGRWCAVETSPVMASAEYASSGEAVADAKAKLSSMTGGYGSTASGSLIFHKSP